MNSPENYEILETQASDDTFTWLLGLKGTYRSKALYARVHYIDESEVYQDYGAHIVIDVIHKDRSSQARIWPDQYVQIYPDNVDGKPIDNYPSLENLLLDISSMVENNTRKIISHLKQGLPL